MNKGALVIISGFSGAGKGCAVKGLLTRYDQYALSVSVTTRDPRPEDKEGVTYFFRSREQFLQMIEDEAFIEYAQYVDNYYGTPRKYVEEQRLAGKTVLLEIEMQGALQVKQKNPEAVLIFVTPPTIEELRNRLIKRNTETPEVIRARLNRAKEEVGYMSQYDYVVINDNLEKCIEELHQIITVEKKRQQHNRCLCEDIRLNFMNYDVERSN